MEKNEFYQNPEVKEQQEENAQAAERATGNSSHDRSEPVSQESESGGREPITEPEDVESPSSDSPESVYDLHGQKTAGQANETEDHSATADEVATEEPQLSRQIEQDAGLSPPEETENFSHNETLSGESSSTPLAEPETVPFEQDSQTGTEQLSDTEGGSEDEDSEMETGHPEESYYHLSRSELVDLLEKNLEEEDVTAIKAKVALIKVAFLKITKEEQQEKMEQLVSEDGGEEGAEEKTDEISQKFNDLFAIYKARRQRYLEEQEKVKQLNLESKKIILEELKTLIDSEETLKKTYDEFRALQDRWKQIGIVPRSEVNNLWQSYHFYIEKFFDKVRINKELRDLDLKKNLEAKISLCEEAESLLLETSIMASFKQLQKLHERWKEIGPAPNDKKDEIWERFKAATDKINQRRSEHYAQLSEDQKKNLLAKTALCENAEEIITREFHTLRDWQDASGQMSELLKVWKTIGPAPRKQNDEIWERFKSSLDNFFSAKKEYLNSIKEEQLNNYNLKLNLCMQAEAIKSGTDWKKTTQEMIALQKEWREIGPVPRKQSDKLWKKFRAACDEFFMRKSDYFSNIEKREGENLAAKEDIIRQIREFHFSDNRNETFETLKEFQRQWTEIGHVPHSEKDRLQSEFRTAINEQMARLDISQAELQTLNFRQRVENLRDDPQSRRMINNERTFLINKRRKLEDEIKLLENNIGFFAESARANLLKEEFEKKIQMARNEIELLSAKIKILGE
ncbi:MAG: DUF349 domain-containing protein [Bacteroidales bacterium]|nr:DUF349 domain-containing protein [Bacteroidales bacterium]